MKMLVSALMVSATAVGADQGVLSATDSKISMNVEDIIPSVDQLILNDANTPITKYQMMRNLQYFDESLFHSVIMSNPTKYLPLIYTPTVGAACLAFSDVTPVNSGGIYITPEDYDNMPALLQQWPNAYNVKMVVITDGSRILGLGDLGGDGMGIPIGKASLYSAAGGFAPLEVVPITIDLGSNVRGEDRDRFPSYLGTPSLRARDEGRVMDYVSRLVDAIRKVYPSAIIQWEDFYLDRAFNILEEFRYKTASFNDDIQGTASVVLGGILSAARAEAIADAVESGKSDVARNLLKSGNIGKLSQHTYLFVGAGSASLGVAELLVKGMVTLEGIDETLARQQIYMMDSAGLLTHKRDKKVTDAKKLAFTLNDALPSASIEEVIHQLRPSVIIGLAAQGPIFTQNVLKAMGAVNKRPIVFALSNPTTKAECSAQDVYDATQGRGIFASGSPFNAPTATKGFVAPPPVVSQCNNMFIFPGVGLGASVGGLKEIDDESFIIAATTLAKQVSFEELSQKVLFPSLNKLRETSRAVAEAVIRHGVKKGMARIASSVDSEKYLSEMMDEKLDAAIWVPATRTSLLVPSPSASPATALEGLVEFLAVDRSFKSNPENLPRPLPLKDYAFAPWGIRHVGASAAAKARALLAVPSAAVAAPSGPIGSLMSFTWRIVSNWTNWILFPVLGLSVQWVLKKVRKNAIHIE